ncbi:MAG: 50S ribosomal protein L29 [Candidatus Bathyarchaeota archaeon]|nr:50S ribosomal protein L29 [Candidatus Bathyarchaeota archaeon]
MPIIRLKDIRDISSEERRKKVTELRTELVRLRTMTKAGGSIENTARIRELRKAVARILTVEHEAKLAEAKEAKKQ